MSCRHGWIPASALWHLHMLREEAPDACSGNMALTDSPPGGKDMAYILSSNSQCKYQEGTFKESDCPGPHSSSVAGH